jgi:hypothetical protein
MVHRAAMKSKVQNFVMGGQWHHNPTALVDKLMANQESLLDIVTPQEFNKIVSIVLNITVLPFPPVPLFRGGGRPSNMNLPVYPGYETSPSVAGPHIWPQVVLQLTGLSPASRCILLVMPPWGRLLASGCIRPVDCSPGSRCIIRLVLLLAGTRLATQLEDLFPSSKPIRIRPRPRVLGRLRRL